MRAAVELAGQQLMWEAEQLRLLAQPHLRHWAIWAQRYSSPAMSAQAETLALAQARPKARHRKYMVALAALGLQQAAILALPVAIYQLWRQRHLAFPLVVPLAFHPRPVVLGSHGAPSSRLSIMAAQAVLLAAIQMEPLVVMVASQGLAEAEAEAVESQAVVAATAGLAA